MNQYISSKNIMFELANLDQLVFEITDACNLKCKYCAYGEFYDDYDSREDKMLSIEKAIHLVNYLTELWNSDMNKSSIRHLFISFYGGEPLLNMPFIKGIVNHIQNKIKCPHVCFRFSMTTNALLLHKYMDYLKDHEFNLLISLDGNKENTGYRVDKSGNCAFERIVRNIDALKKKYPEYFQTYVNFNAVLHNKNSIEEIYRFFKDRYDKMPSIGELNNMGIRKDKQDDFNKTYKNANESLHQSEHYDEIEREMFTRSGTYKSVTLFLHQYSGYVFKDYTDLLFDKSARKTLPTGTCLPFSKKMYVTVNGKILPCERIGHHFALGEITDTEIIIDAEAIADKYNAYYAKFEEQCCKCKIAKSCIQCIFNVANLNEEKPVCHGFMNEKRFGNYINSQMHFLEKHPEAYLKIMKEVIVM